MGFYTTVTEKMSKLEKIKEIAEQMPDCPEKQQAMQAYSNLKMFEVMADSFENVVEKAPNETKHPRLWQK